MMETDHQQVDSAHPVLVTAKILTGRERAMAHEIAGPEASGDEIDGKLVNDLIESLRKPIEGVLRNWGAKSGANVGVSVFLEKPRE